MHALSCRLAFEGLMVYINLHAVCFFLSEISLTNLSTLKLPGRAPVQAILLSTITMSKMAVWLYMC